MPILRKKGIKLPQSIPREVLEREDGNSDVYYLRPSREIFTSYEDFVTKLGFFQQKIWQCETTGRQNLTYEEAAASERSERRKVARAFCGELRKLALQRAQFQTHRLDLVVDDAYNHFLHRFCFGETVNCLWEDNVHYHAKIKKIIRWPPEETPRNDLPPVEKVVNSYLSNAPVDGDSESRSTPASQSNGGQNAEAVAELERTSYGVVLVDENGHDIEDCYGIMHWSRLSRDRLVFSKNMLRKFFKEFMTKDTYVGAPWLVKPHLAKRLDLDVTLPYDLLEARNQAYRKSKKRKARGEEDEMHDESMNGDRPQSIRLPVDDLALRYLQLTAHPIINMPPFKNTDDDDDQEEKEKEIDRRPIPSSDCTMSYGVFERFLSVWAFVSVYSKPLILSPFSLDDFESALRHRVADPKCSLCSEVFVALTNIVIRERRKRRFKRSDQAPPSLSGKPQVKQDEASPRRPDDVEISEADDKAEEFDSLPVDDVPSESESRGEEEARAAFWATWRHLDLPSLTAGWDSREVKPTPEEDRKNRVWEEVLVGLVYELGSFELIPSLRTIMTKWLPSPSDLMQSITDKFWRLDLQYKLELLEFLVGLVTQSEVIRSYMEECQETMTELRKQRIELSRERKKIVAARLDLDRQDNSENPSPAPEPQESDSEIIASDTESQVEDTMTNGKSNGVSRHQSRQATLREKELQKQAAERARKKQYEKSRQEAKVRTQELKLRAQERKKLDLDEQAIDRKAEQIERDLHRFATLRITPLGYDRYFNRYYFIDNVGGMNGHGSGKLYVHNPSKEGLALLSQASRMQEAPQVFRYLQINPSVLTWATIKKGMELDGFAEELSRMDDLLKQEHLLEDVVEVKSENGVHRSFPKLETEKRSSWSGEGSPPEEEDSGWWFHYDDNDQIDQLIKWLDKRGIRENKLRNELNRQRSSIQASVRKHNQELQSVIKHEQIRRSTRTRTTQSSMSSEPYMAYVNKARS